MGPCQPPPWGAGGGEGEAPAVGVHSDELGADLYKQGMKKVQLNFADYLW